MLKLNANEILLGLKTRFILTQQKYLLLQHLPHINIGTLRGVIISISLQVPKLFFILHVHVSKLIIQVNITLMNASTINGTLL